MLRFPSLPSRGRVIASALLLAIVAAFGLTRWINASDHKDSALLAADHAADIADVYTFQSPVHPENVVLVMTVSGFIPPSEASTTFFDPGVLYQWKIDNDGDAVEDLVIQAFVTGAGRHQVMHFRGPVEPPETGVANRITHGHSKKHDHGKKALPGSETAHVRVSTTETPIVASHRGVAVFAGVRDDPFFFDLAQFKKVVAGEATSFRNPGLDSFAGTNVLAIVIELPSELLGGPQLGVWGTTSRQQF